MEVGCKVVRIKFWLRIIRSYSDWGDVVGDYRGGVGRKWKGVY